ncbi:MAG: transglycosylase SLT domain-containing protein [Azoarcus sp.]|nr:transglycosylase SLT domain-containing protein [Azoarcus sp.]
MFCLSVLVSLFACSVPVRDAETPRASAAPSVPRTPSSLLVVDLKRVPEKILTLDLTRTPDNLWDRVRRGFGMPELHSAQVSRQQSAYLKRPEYLERMFNRSGRYLYYIVEELERRGMPTELALLPMVESSFNPHATSRARASGLWQFIPSTGRAYKLTQNRWVDERRDVIASTEAALDYFENIYTRHKDWHLALASYNRGENAIGRAVARNRAAGRSAEFSALRLPTETRNYLPKLQALKNIIADPQLFGIELPHIPNEQFLATVDAPPGIDLATAAQYAELPIKEFLAFNPGYNRPAITAPGQTLLVPFDRAERFSARLDEFRRSGNGWRSHILAQGETLDGIAGRYGLSLAQLLQVNGLRPRSRPKLGYSLLVPGRGVDLDDVLAVSELLPASARSAARAGVYVVPEPRAKSRKGLRGKTPVHARNTKAQTKKSAKKPGVTGKAGAAGKIVKTKPPGKTQKPRR